MDETSFDSFISELVYLGEDTGMPGPGEAIVANVGAAAQALANLPNVDRDTIAQLIHHHPTWVPILASCVGLSLEQLKRQLQHRLKTSGWVTLARRDPMRLVAALDEKFELIKKIRIQRARKWTFGDVLLERYASWSRASRSVKRGRDLEDKAEKILKSLGISYEMRKNFVGARGEEAPCDFAIPAAGTAAQIVGAVKGFDSTGSKLSDAVREIERMAAVRLPRQFVFALVDGIGWLGRRKDLKKIHELRVTKAIDGLYSLARIDEFREDLRRAGERLGLL